MQIFTWINGTNLTQRKSNNGHIIIGLTGFSINSITEDMQPLKSAEMGGYGVVKTQPWDNFVCEEDSIIHNVACTLNQQLQGLYYQQVGHVLLGTKECKE